LAKFRHAVRGYCRQRSVGGYSSTVRRTAKMSEQAKSTIGYLSNSFL